jgi:hypothetical protein
VNLTYLLSLEIVQAPIPMFDKSRIDILRPQTAEVDELLRNPSDSSSSAAPIPFPRLKEAASESA